MIPSAREIASALYGAYRLARIDAGGMAFFDASTQGFWRSFFAAVLVAPFYAVFLAVRFPDFEGAVDPLAYAVVETMAYVVAWLAYPVVMASLTRMLGRAERFVGYIVAYNWAAVWQNVLLLPLAILGGLGIVPTDAWAFLYLIVLGAVLAYVWVVARLALELPPLTCAAIVILDLALTRLIMSFAEGRYLPPGA